MSYTVTIEYTGIEKDVDKIGCQIANLFCPIGSYADSPVYKCGCPVDADDDEKYYGKSVYADNVPGKGFLPLPEPYATTSIPFPSPLAQFKLAIVGEDNVVSFDVETYAEAFYYMDIGAQMASQGFVVTVESDEDSDDTGGGDVSPTSANIATMSACTTTDTKTVKTTTRKSPKKSTSAKTDTTKDAVTTESNN